ncbi:hypothetical protein BDQ12DRAFT_667128 [Crucibulum laeve]|uniref:DUF6533 domain-containing protein n=1 Tax=Crucibulum laeve TaxID=68775 RepID=A0A5C3LWT1_9AGAR|nr:hypothetical protein BDQ12DRAFT_667128 [Crucibulum laeve]
MAGDRSDIDLLWSIHTRQCSSLAALTVLIWEYLITCQHEYHFMWRWVLLKPVSTCRGWFTFLLGCSCLILGIVDIVLMLRVYALYKRSRKVAAILLTLFISEVIVEFVTGYLSISRAHFNAACDLLKVPIEVMYFLAMTFLTQTVIWTMTLAKRKRKPHLRNIPLLSRVIRDGAWVWFLICGMCSSAVPYSMIKITTGDIIFVWPITLVSIATCRLIINIQRLKKEDTRWERRHVNLQSDEVILTTNIHISTDDLPVLEHNSRAKPLAKKSEIHSVLGQMLNLHEGQTPEYANQGRVMPTSWSQATLCFRPLLLGGKQSLEQNGSTVTAKSMFLEQKQRKEREQETA